MNPNYYRTKHPPCQLVGLASPPPAAKPLESSPSRPLCGLTEFSAVLVSLFPIPYQLLTLFWGLCLSSLGGGRPLRQQSIDPLNSGCPGLPLSAAVRPVPCLVFGLATVFRAALEGGSSALHVKTGVGLLPTDTGHQNQNRKLPVTSSVPSLPAPRFLHCSMRRSISEALLSYRNRSEARSFHCMSQDASLLPPQFHRHAV